MAMETLPQSDFVYTRHEDASRRHKEVVSLHLANWSRVAICEATGYTDDSVRKILRHPPNAEYVRRQMHSLTIETAEAMVGVAGLVGKAVKAVATRLDDDGHPKEQLSAAKLVFEYTGILGRRFRPNEEIEPVAEFERPEGGLDDIKERVALEADGASMLTYGGSTEEGEAAPAEVGGSVDEWAWLKSGPAAAHDEGAGAVADASVLCHNPAGVSVAGTQGVLTAGGGVGSLSPASTPRKRVAELGSGPDPWD